MCGRYQTDFDNPKEFIKRYEIEGKLPDGIKTSYNVRPGTEQPVVLTHSPNHVELMQWGYIPGFARTQPTPRVLINVRSDSLLKPWMKHDLIAGRCIIPAKGFYEPKGPKGMKNRPQYFFKLKNDDYISFAGVYCEYAQTKGKKVRLFAIITTDPNEIVGKVHDRMPAILDKQNEDEWLNPDNVEHEQLIKLINPFPARLMESWPVSLRVNQWGQDDPDLIKQINSE